MPARSTPWRQAAFCVLDLETTGLLAPDDEIIAFATMPVDGGRARVRDAHSRLVRPGACPGPIRSGSMACARRTSPARRP